MAVKLFSSFRYLFKKPIALSVATFCIGLFCSKAMIEISIWVTAIFLVAYGIADYLSERKAFEVFTMGFEIPLGLFLTIFLIGLHLNNEQGIQIETLGKMRALIAIYIIAYSLQVYKNLNGIFAILMMFTVVLSSYGIFQQLTGIDPLTQGMSHFREVNIVGFPLRISQGFFGSENSFYSVLLMMAPVFWATLVVRSSRRAVTATLFGVIGLSITLIALLMSFSHHVWITIPVFLGVMAVVSGRRQGVITLLVLAICIGGLLKGNGILSEITNNVLNEKYLPEKNRKAMWHVDMEIYQDHPWIGAGFGNPEKIGEKYAQKLQVPFTPGPADSTYLEIMASMGTLGIAAYMLFVLSTLMMTLRLFTAVPTTHFWHRVFVLSCLGAQISFHISGLFIWTWGNWESLITYSFWLGILAYLAQRYYAHIVPDDYSA